MNKRLMEKLIDFLKMHDKVAICNLLKNDKICELIFEDLSNTYDCWEPDYYQKCVEFIQSLDFDALLTFYNYVTYHNLGYTDWITNTNHDNLLKIAKFIVNKHCTRDYRHLIQLAEVNMDMTSVEKLRKEYIDFELSNFEMNERMLSNYYHFYQELINNNIDEALKIKNNFNIKIPVYLEEEFQMALQSADYSKIKLLFQLISRIEVSNLIIDYHFENQPFDVLIDIEEILKYQKNGKKTIDERAIDFYLKILDLDNIGFKEAIEFHKKMKNSDIQSQFYDDYRKTLDSQYQDIRNSILNEKTIQKYKNSYLTQKYDTTVYYLDGDDFYALVKSLGSRIFTINHGYFQNTAELPSFSLTSHDKLHIFSNTPDNINLIFSSFNPDQIVFTYPCDVGSDCDILVGKRPTNNVNKVYTKKELTNVLPNYNHIIYRNSSIDSNDDFNHLLECPKVLGVYAYDEISSKELNFSKKYNLPIILINTKSYKKPTYQEMDYAAHVEIDDCLDYEYDKYLNIDVEVKRRNNIKKKIYSNH